MELRSATRLRDIMPMIEEVVSDILKSKKPMHTERGKMAVFVTESINGEPHVDWHYTRESAKEGDKLSCQTSSRWGSRHNGEYIWVAPEAKQ